jgi:hypothetical protein
MCICSGDGMIGATPSLQAACATAGGAAAPLSVRPRLAYDEPTPSAIGAAGGTLGRGFGVDETGDSTMCIRRADAEAGTGAAADDAPTRERHLRTILSLADELARLAKAEAETEAAEVAEVVAPAANTIEARSAQRGDSAKRRMTGVMTGVWRYECRCGDEFVLREAQLAAGIDVLQCKSCSYSLRPLYCRVDDG